MAMMYLRKCGDIFMQFFMLKKWQWYSVWLCQIGITSIDRKRHTWYFWQITSGIRFRREVKDYEDRNV